MACVAPFFQFNSDESYALELQLAEIEAQRELQTGKWPENNPPDVVMAYDDFESELVKLRLMIEDIVLARSIAVAVESDAMVIEEITVEEIQSVRDREFARSLIEDGQLTASETIGLPEMVGSQAGPVNWEDVSRAMEASTLSIGSSTTVAGPSTRHALHEEAIRQQLPSAELECSVCGDSHHPNLTVRLACNDIYCKPCLKTHVLRCAKNEEMFPPKCHSKYIDVSAIEGDLSTEELTIYRNAGLEFNSSNRVYCANPECAKFIPPLQRTPDIASCEACGTDTCMYCKAVAHSEGCPSDEGRQSLIDLGKENDWQECKGCGQMVFRFDGCDHMTCRCGTQFCYRCGIKWKECACSDWEPALRNRRAQVVVDREAVFPLAPAIRQQRVAVMERELQENHQCNHRGKFMRLEGSRRGKVCEMCGTRHRKYILSCRQCHMLVCEDCRRYRV